eukprot:COSAG02_NODE_549_length_20461_cov_11.385866_19_plen_74_part_00
MRTKHSHTGRGVHSHIKMVVNSRTPGPNYDSRLLAAKWLQSHSLPHAHLNALITAGDLNSDGVTAGFAPLQGR